MDLFLRNSSFKMLELTFSSKLDWCFYIISIAKTASKKIGAFICSMKFLSAEVTLYLYRPTIWPSMEYWCRIWVRTPSCYLELLDKLQKWICRTVSPSLATYLKPLAHWQNRYYFGKCSSELAKLVPLPFLKGELLVVLIDCMIFLSPFLDITRMSMSTVSFLTKLDSGILSL